MCRSKNEKLTELSEIQGHADSVRAGTEVHGDVAAGVCGIAAADDVVHAGLAYRDADCASDEGGNAYRCDK